MLHPSDEAFAFDERRQLGEVTSIVGSRACSAYLAAACTGRPGHLPSGSHVPNVMGT
jgi:p-hydroxybenzoate 3-monooxygenase